MRRPAIGAARRRMPALCTGAQGPVDRDHWPDPPALQQHIARIGQPAGDREADVELPIETPIHAALVTPAKAGALSPWVPAFRRDDEKDFPDYALSSATEGWYKTGTYGLFLRV